MSARRYFEIGWDFAAAGLPLPVQPLTSAMREGHLQGCFHFGRRALAHDEYVRKWLFLRLSAADRDRIFDDSVTPAYLRLINRERCPITGETLTYASGGGSDWSTDRLWNIAGYSRGNICMMSSTANRAKGSATIVEVLNRAWASRPIERLEQRCWEKLYGLMAGVCEYADGYVMRPLTCNPGRPHAEQLVAGLHAVQLVLTNALVADDGSLDALAEGVPTAARGDWDRAVDIVRVANEDFEDALECWTEVACLRALGCLADSAGTGWIQRIQREEAASREGCPTAAEASAVRATFGLETRGFARERVY